LPLGNIVFAIEKILSVCYNKMYEEYKVIVDTL